LISIDSLALASPKHGRNWAVREHWGARSERPIAAVRATDRSGASDLMARFGRPKHWRRATEGIDASDRRAPSRRRIVPVGPTGHVDSRHRALRPDRVRRPRGRADRRWTC
jgi:hypothetical protein